MRFPSITLSLLFHIKQSAASTDMVRLERGGWIDKEERTFPGQCDNYDEQAWQKVIDSCRETEGLELCSEEQYIDAYENKVGTVDKGGLHAYTSTRCTGANNGYGNDPQPEGHIVMREQTGGDWGCHSDKGCFPTRYFRCCKSETLAPTMTPPGLDSWYINSTGVATEEVTSKDTITITLPFNSTNRKNGALVFVKDCINTFAIDEYPYFVTSTTTPISTKSDGYVEFNTTLAMNVTSINNTDYWNVFTDGTRGGWVETCVETFLIFEDDIDLGNDDSQQKVVFRNTVLNISVSLTATYEVDEVDVKREEAVNKSIRTDYSNFITAYACDESNLYAKETTTYNQGDEITICVTDESTGIVQVEDFVNLVVTQPGVDNYNYINNGMWNPDITTPVCVDGSTSLNRRVCFAKIRALARFFQSENPLDLTISGSVYVIRDGRRVLRNLHSALPAPENNSEKDGIEAFDHRMQEEETGSGEFGITVSIASADDIAASGGTVKSVVTGLMTMVVGAAGASLVV